MTRLEKLTAGMAIVYGGDKVASVPAQLAGAFHAGDRLLVVQETGELLHVPCEVQEIASAAVGAPHEAFPALAGGRDAQITALFQSFPPLLDSRSVWKLIA